MDLISILIEEAKKLYMMDQGVWDFKFGDFSFEQKRERERENISCYSILLDDRHPLAVYKTFRGERNDVGTDHHQNTRTEENEENDDYDDVDEDHHQTDHKRDSFGRMRRNQEWL